MNKISFKVIHPICICTLVVLCWIVFSPILENGFILKWDDQWQVTNAYTASEWTINNVAHIFCYAYNGQYSPLNQLMYKGIYSIGGFNTVLFHATSILLHGINACLVYCLTYKLLNDLSRFTELNILLTSFLMSVFFIVHPLQVESVAWISASKILLSSLFYLAACLVFVRFLANKEKWHEYLLSYILFVLGLLSKEQTVVLPLMLVLFCHWYGLKIMDRKVCKWLFPFVITSVAFGLIFIFVTRSDAATGNSTSFTMVQRVVFACYAVAEYICKAVVPYNLHFKYFYPLQSDGTVPYWLFSYPLLIASAIVCLYPSVRSNRSIRYGLSIFLVHIFLVLGIIPMGRQHVVADRYMYLPIIGIGYIWANGFIQTNWKKISQRMPMYAYIMVLSWISILAVYSNCRCRMWKDSETIYSEINI